MERVLGLFVVVDGKGEVVGVFSRRIFWNKLCEVWYEILFYYLRRGCVICWLVVLGVLYGCFFLV